MITPLDFDSLRVAATTSKSTTFDLFKARQPFRLTHVDAIINLADQYVNSNLRFCYHSPDSLLHEMLILERRGVFYPPHIHPDRVELHMVFSGVLEVYTVHSDGSHNNSFLNHSETLLASRIEPGTPHLTIPHTPYVVYLEMKNGLHRPFHLDCFSPDSSLPQGQSYLNYLSSHL